ncbi:MAG: flagellar basal body P-ring formation chaperone FlgA [Parvularcula sp.]|nr:flagellar basal body P-ring formation chaperone FlgA [Parvularcula sp.]
MIKHTLLCLFAVFGIAFAAEGALDTRIAAALRETSLLPLDAEITVSRLTPVRGAVETVEISRFDPQTGFFEAIIGHGQNRKTIDGRAEVLVPVVVARHLLRREEPISMDDLELRRVPIHQVPPSAFIVAADLEGMAVRRSLPAGRPIRQDDVGAPVIMRKNAAITIAYARAGLELTASGRALDEGAVGESIRVMMDSGGTIVRGEVVAPNKVTVH